MPTPQRAEPASHLVLALIVLTGAAFARGSNEPARETAPDPVVVSVRTGKIVARDSIRPGWTRVRVEKDGAGHLVVIFRLPERTSDADVASFLVALDTAAATPRPAVAMGGPEIGDIGEVVVQFTPGRYVFGCVSRGTDGHRHARTGEAKMFVVVQGRPDSAHAGPPRASQEVRMLDFAYTAAEKWPAGHHMLRVENRGRQDHLLLLVRLRPGSSMKDWATAADPTRHAVRVAGVARMGPGQVAYFPAELSPGVYVAYCRAIDGATKRPHQDLGMFRSIKVE